MTVLVMCLAVLLSCSLAGLLIGPLPDFSDPLVVSASDMAIMLCQSLVRLMTISLTVSLSSSLSLSQPRPSTFFPKQLAGAETGIIALRCQPINKTT